MRRAALVILLVLASSPAWAIKEWYDYYDDARKDVERERYREAIASLREAIRLKSKSALKEQTYGLDFIDYLPYYYEGLSHFRLGDWASAVLLFNEEEKQGAIKKTPLYETLVKMRNEAAAKRRDEIANAEKQRKAQAALDEVKRLEREAEDLQKAGKLVEAQAPLLAAQTAAELLDPAIRQHIQDRLQKIRQEASDRQDQAKRAQRLEKIEKDLEAGGRLLEEGKPAEAKVRFEDVLDQEAGNVRAREGKRAAEDAILAYTTQQERLKLLQEGKALYEGGEFEKALKPLTEAEADPNAVEARDLLRKVRQALEGVQRQKDLRLRIDVLLAEGERLLAAGHYPQAMVKLADVLSLDPTHVRARERLGYAERLTGNQIFEKIFPNREPTVAFLESPPAEVEGPTVALVGLATDDRGLTRIEYRLGGRVVFEQPLAPDRSGDFPTTFQVRYVFPLEPGKNEISVDAVDTTGVVKAETFTIERRLRFYETRAFWPSAVLAAAALVGGGLFTQHARRQRALRRRFNPYIAGAPVMDDHMFFGREKLLQRILNVLHHNSLMITGERRIGKTTFLYHLKRALEHDHGTEYRFFPVLTDLQGVLEEGFFHALITDVVDTLEPPAAVQATLRYRPQHEQYDGRDFSHDLQRVIEHLKTTTDKRVKLALLIDEVDVLNEFSERINQRLRSIFMKTFSEHLVAIMSGVGIKRTWTSEGSPWYNFFDQVELSAFTREEAEALIKEPVEEVFRFEPDAVEGILAYSQLKPYVIQKYCVHAVNRILEEERTTITRADVEAVRDTVHADGPEEASPVLRRQASA